MGLRAPLLPAIAVLVVAICNAKCAWVGMLRRPSQRSLPVRGVGECVGLLLIACGTRSPLGFHGLRKDSTQGLAGDQALRYGGQTAAVKCDTNCMLEGEI